MLAQLRTGFTFTASRHYGVRIEWAPLTRPSSIQCYDLGDWTRLSGHSSTASRQYCDFGERRCLSCPSSIKTRHCYDSGERRCLSYPSSIKTRHCYDSGEWTRLSYPLSIASRYYDLRIDWACLKHVLHKQHQGITIFLVTKPVCQVRPSSVAPRYRFDLCDWTLLSGL